MTAPAASAETARAPGGEARPDAATQIAGLGFAMILLKPDLTIAELNPAAEEMLGKGEARLIGLPLHSAMFFAEDAVRLRMEASDAPLTARQIAVTIGSTERSVSMTMSPLPAAAGWRVLTLSEAGENASGLSAQRGPSILAHEIKNPLAAIRGAGQLLARKLGPADSVLTDLISDEVARIARLVDRMQVLGSSQREPVNRFNMHVAIRSALASIRSAEVGSVTILEEFDPSLPDVLASRDALQQVVVNLVTNALNACDQVEDPRVIVRTRFASGLSCQSLESGTSVSLPLEIIVMDNGPGVPPEIRDQMFEPFVTTKPDGQGLGLPLVRKLLSDMGARIVYTRDEKLGLSTFRINLAVAS